MTRYDTGRRIEYKAKKELEKEGYFVMRSAGSKGTFDLAAFNFKSNSTRLIQIKSINRSLSDKMFEKEIKELQHLSIVNPFIRFELWVWKKRQGFILQQQFWRALTEQSVKDFI